MYYIKKEREEYTEMRLKACEELGISVNRFNALRRLASEIQQLNALSENGEIEEQSYFTGLNDVYADIRAIIQKSKKPLYFYHRSDPGDCSIYISRIPLDRINYVAFGTPIY